MGKTGSPSGIYSIYRIPFGTSVRVTIQRSSGHYDDPVFRWIIRGVENLPVEIGGVRLPERSRLSMGTGERRRSSVVPRHSTACAWDRQDTAEKEVFWSVAGKPVLRNAQRMKRGGHSERGGRRRGGTRRQSATRRPHSTQDWWPTDSPTSGAV